MAGTFMERVADARAAVPAIGVAEVRRRLHEDPNTLVVDVRDERDLRATGVIPGTHHVSLGTLLYKADHSLPEDWRDPELGDKDRPIVTTCGIGAMAAIAAKELKDLGFTNVAVLEGGTQGWIDAGQPTEPFAGA